MRRARLWTIVGLLVLAVVLLGYVAVRDWSRALHVGADTIVSGIVALITLAGVVGSLIYAGRESKRSEGASARAEAASSATIDALDRIAVALEKSGPETAAAASAAMIAALSGTGSLTVSGVASVPTVQWSLTHYKGDTYQLENIGDAVANDVAIHMDASMFIPRELPEGVTIGPHEAETFMAAKSLGTRDSTVTVTWIDAEESERTWRYPLPPRPPR